MLEGQKEREDDPLKKQIADLTLEQRKALREQLKEQLDRDQSWSKHFDFKVGYILATDGVLIGLISKLLADNAAFFQRNSLTYLGIVPTFLLLVGSIIYSLLAISPTLSLYKGRFREKVKQPLTRDDVGVTQVFFDHIAQYGSYTNFGYALVDLIQDEALYCAQMIQQVYANAAVASDKAIQVRWCTQLLFLGILVAIATAILAIALWLLGK
jgi:hypothetical protein